MKNQDCREAELNLWKMAHTNPKFSIIVGGKNFGCGSSREHAPLALQMAGVKAVVAQTYARIFYRNSVDGGFVMPLESVENIYKYLFNRRRSSYRLWKEISSRTLPPESLFPSVLSEMLLK